MRKDKDRRNQCDTLEQQLPHATPLLYQAALTAPALPDHCLLDPAVLASPGKTGTYRRKRLDVATRAKPQHSSTTVGWSPKLTQGEI